MENAPSNGSDPGLEALLEQHRQDAMAYIKRHADPVVLRQESGSDLVQSVYREFLGRRDGFEWRGLPAFRKLLFRSLLAKLVDRKLFYQRDKRDVRRTAQLDNSGDRPAGERVPSPFLSPSQVAVGREDLDRFQRCFGRLSPDYQLVIRRARLEGRTHEEIAEELCRERGAVKVLLHRALIRLGVLMDTDARA